MWWGRQEFAPEKAPKSSRKIHCTEHLSQMEFLSLSGLVSISDRSDNLCAEAWLAALEKNWTVVEQPTNCSVQLKLHWKMIKTKVAFHPALEGGHHCANCHPSAPSKTFPHANGSDSLLNACKWWQCLSFAHFLFNCGYTGKYCEASLTARMCLS